MGHNFRSSVTHTYLKRGEPPSSFDVIPHCFKASLYYLVDCEDTAFWQKKTRISIGRERENIFTENLLDFVTD